MERAIEILFIGTLLCGEVFGQQPAEQPRFEMADVHVSAKTLASRMRSSLAPSGRNEIRSATMVDLIQAGYSFEPDKVVGGPSWLEIRAANAVAAGFHLRRRTNQGGTESHGGKRGGSN
jgi:hypothetical protein